MKNKTARSFVSMMMLLSLLLLTACGGGKSENSGSSPASTAPAAGTPSITPEPKKEPVELTFATFNDWATTNGEGLKEAFALYEKATGNKIKLDVYPNDQFANVLKTKLATGDVPDFFSINLGEQYVPYTNLEPLSGPWADKMLPAVKDLASKDGKIYEAYTSPLGYLAVVYNKKAFEKAGIQVPLLTYQQLVDACEALQKSGVTPIFLQGKEVWTAEMIPALGGIYMMKKDPENAKKLISNQIKPSEMPGFIDLANRVLALKKYVNPDFMSTPLSSGYQGLADGKYAMTFMGDWIYDEIAKSSPDQIGDLSMMPITLGDDEISAVSSFVGHAMGVPAAAKHKEEAKEAINFFLQPENFKTLVKPYKGGSPYDGYESEMNPWQKDMQDILSRHQIPTTDSYFKATVGNFDFSASFTPWSDMFAGKPIPKALDDWYKDYAKTNRAKKTPGF